MNILDGPHRGRHFLVRNCPEYVRVVEKQGQLFETGDGEVDVCDMPDDEPARDETIYVYRRVGEVAACHINFGRGRGGFYQMADYRYVATMPEEDAELRDNDRWREWVASRAG